MHVFINKGRSRKVKSGQKGKRKYPAFAVKRIKYNRVLLPKKMHRKSKRLRMKLKSDYCFDQYLMKSARSNVYSKSYSLPSVYKNLNHRINHCTFNLSNDVETNPGPSINSTKTIQAPYSQDNVLLFGSNAGT